MPGALFAFLFTEFNYLDRNLELIEIILIVWISLAPHWIYRVFYAVLAKTGNWLYINKNEIHPKFNDFDLAALSLLWEDRNQFEAHKKAFFNLAFPVFFYLPTALLSLTYILRESMSACMSCGFFAASTTLFIVGIVLFLARTDAD